MLSIKFEGPALVDSGQDNDDGTVAIINDKKILKSFDGLQYQDEEFSDYLGDGDGTSLIADCVSGGILSFKYDKKTETLVGFIEYQLTRALSSDEVEALKEYTIDQLSDGIGSNFSQENALNGKPSPFINYQELTVESRS
jgi:hypothetical protein